MKRGYAFKASGTRNVLSGRWNCSNQPRHYRPEIVEDLTWRRGLGKGGKPAPARFAEVAALCISRSNQGPIQPNEPDSRGSGNSRARWRPTIGGIRPPNN